MADLNAKEIEKIFTLKQLQAYNAEIRSQYNVLKLEHNRVIRQQQAIINKEVEIRTKEYVDQ